MEPYIKKNKHTIHQGAVPYCPLCLRGGGTTAGEAAAGKTSDHGSDLWVHGHTHNSFNYKLGKTRVIVNHYGYEDVEVNPQYDGDLLIDL